MNKYILKSDSSFMVIGKSPAWIFYDGLNTNLESGRVFSLTQAVNFDFSSNRQPSKQLGYQNYSSNIEYTTSQVNLSIDYYFSPYLNNELLMGFNNSGVNSQPCMYGFKNKNYNFYFFSNKNDNASGFGPIAKTPENQQNWSGYEVICFGNCYLENYSLSMSIGQAPIISTKFKSSNISAEMLTDYLGTIKESFQMPSLDPYYGIMTPENIYPYKSLKISGLNITGDIEGRNDLNPPITLPYKSLISIKSTSVSNEQLTPLRNFNDLILQSCSLNLDFSRVDLYRIGNRSVCDRKLQFPINANIQIESLVSGFNVTTGNAPDDPQESATLTNSENLYDINLSFSNQKESITGFYNFKDAKLNSLNYSTQLNNTYKLSASFSVEITEKNGFYMGRKQK